MRIPKAFLLTPSGFTDGTFGCSEWNTGPWTMKQPSACGTPGLFGHGWLYGFGDSSIFLGCSGNPLVPPILWFCQAPCSSLTGTTCCLAYQLTNFTGNVAGDCFTTLDFAPAPAHVYRRAGSVPGTDCTAFCGSYPSSLTLTPFNGPFGTCGCCGYRLFPTTLYATVTASTCADIPVNTRIALSYVENLITADTSNPTAQGWKGSYTGASGQVYEVDLTCAFHKGPQLYQWQVTLRCGLGGVISSGEVQSAFACSPLSVGVTVSLAIACPSGCINGDSITFQITEA